MVKKTHKVSTLFILLNVTDGLLNDFAASKKKSKSKIRLYDFIKQNSEACVEKCAAVRKRSEGVEETEDEKRLYEGGQL